MHKKGKAAGKYIGFIGIAMEVAGRLLPKYSSKYSKHTYTQPQLAVALLLMKRDRKSYRSVMEALEEVKEAMGMKKSVPHFTTLNKFLDRLSLSMLDALLRMVYLLLFHPKGNVEIAIDSTGYSKRNVSFHYLWRIGGMVRHREHVKHSIAADLENQAIMASISRYGGLMASTERKLNAHSTGKATAEGV